MHDSISSFHLSWGLRHLHMGLVVGGLPQEVIKPLNMGFIVEGLSWGWTISTRGWYRLKVGPSQHETHWGRLSQEVYCSLEDACLKKDWHLNQHMWLIAWTEGLSWKVWWGLTRPLNMHCAHCQNTPPLAIFWYTTGIWSSIRSQ